MTIGITLGDPSGIGPEIVAATLQRRPELTETVMIFGDAGVLARAGLPDGFPVVPVTALTLEDAPPGIPTLAGAAAQVAYLEAAVAAARAGEIDGIVTAPISKTQAHAAGFDFPGHTEFFAERLDAPEHAMLFAGPRLNVILATVHLALADVPRRLSADDVARAVFLGGQAMARDFGISGSKRPRIGVVGLNPHAGEGGMFGREELDVIRPGMDAGRLRLQAAGIDAVVDGPLVPDAAFRLERDLFVAMYHDQGLIPAKLLDFELSVNVTVGLPLPRTSPDHGTAYDIAGRGVARPDSFAAALALCERLIRNRTGR